MFSYNLRLDAPLLPRTATPSACPLAVCDWVGSELDGTLGTDLEWLHNVLAVHVAEIRE